MSVVFAGLLLQPLYSLEPADAVGKNRESGARLGVFRRGMYVS